MSASGRLTAWSGHVRQNRIVLLRYPSIAKS
jgi:hypothetical protein